MADVTITPQDLAVSGITPTFTAVSAIADDFYLTNNGRVLLEVANDSGSSVTVTITGENSCDQGFTHDETITIDDGDSDIIGPFSMTRFNDENGRVLINFSAATSITYAAYKGV